MGSWAANSAFTGMTPGVGGGDGLGEPPRGCYSMGALEGWQERGGKVSGTGHLVVVAQTTHQGIALRKSLLRGIMVGMLRHPLAARPSVALVRRQRPINHRLPLALRL